MASRTSTKPWIIEHKYYVLNLRNLDDTLMHQKHVDLLLGTKGFETNHSVKIGELIIEPPKNVIFVKIPS
jgi:hypothetical protein